MATLPTRVFAGVQVPDTPLITKALALCREHLSDLAYNHCVRSWLFGFIIAAKTPELQDRDLEVHAIAAILHDLGWAEETSDLVTEDKRFEVDGANAARIFLKNEAGDWDKHRLQLVWDAIALHTTPSIAVSYFPSSLRLVSSAFGVIRPDSRVKILAVVPRAPLPLKGHADRAFDSITRNLRSSPRAMESSPILPDLI